eukprot:s99_g6.t1
MCGFPELRCLEEEEQRCWHVLDPVESWFHGLLKEPRGRRDWGFEDAEQVEPEDSEFNSFGEELEQSGQSGALAALCAALDRSLAEAKEALKVHKSKAVEAASEEPQTGLLEQSPQMTPRPTSTNQAAEDAQKELDEAFERARQQNREDVDQRLQINFR